MHVLYEALALVKKYSLDQLLLSFFVTRRFALACVCVVYFIQVDQTISRIDGLDECVQLQELWIAECQLTVREHVYMQVY